ncbi:unnamed protein product [Adineta steineri]|uniref:RHD domain-containing protein n=2 Tax=Adineta steineri TaxID=433720 RepID=A0A813X591_9BILA|nr:unnamed protein product [Adineta steineri]
MSLSKPTLRLVAEPQQFYRSRYASEMCRNGTVLNRFIITGSNSAQFKYPTVEILKEWYNQGLYICVILVTVPTEEAPIQCIHPHPIDTDEVNVVKNEYRNSLFFPITEEDCINGFKSFRIIRKKLIQYELKNYGPLHIVHSNDNDIQRIDDPPDVRKLSKVYQLEKSQLLFSLVQTDPNGRLIVLSATSVYSNIMTATKDRVTNNTAIIRCSPQKGHWIGGDDILMVIPISDRKTPCEIYFEYPSLQRQEPVSFRFVDSKTITFTTPSCLIEVNENHKIEVPIVVRQNNQEVARVNFCYEPSTYNCRCNNDSIFNFIDESNTSELSSSSSTFCDVDDDLAEYM